MATITGSKYSGLINTYSASSRQLTITGTSFTSSDFNKSRMVVAYNNSNKFMGLAIVRRFINSTNLELESNFFDPITQSEVTVTTGSFEVSNTLVESGGWTASGLILTQTASHNIGTYNNERSACIYDEGKIITSDRLNYFGGVVLLGRPTQQGKSLTNPCTLRYTSGGVKMQTKSTYAHFFMFGGSLAVQSTPVYFGGYQGSAGGSFLFDSVNTQSADLLSKGAGGNWGSNEDRHVLRNIKTLAGSHNAISVRWGDGVISGGQYQLIGSIALSIFGSDKPGTYNISAPAGSRLIAQEVGRGSKPALFRSNGYSILTVNYNNVVSPERRFSSGSSGITNFNGLGIFTYTDAYSNAIVGTKLVIVDSSGNIVDSGTSNGVDPLELTVEESRIQGATETVTESNWNFYAFIYGKNIVAGSFSTTTQSTIGGDAKNVAHGSVILQSNDVSISESNKTTVDAYPISVSITSNNINVTGDSTTVQNLTSAQLYDLLASYLEDNFGTHTDFLITRSGNEINANGYNVGLSYINYTGDMVTDQVINLYNGSIFNGIRTDQNGTVYPPIDVTFTDLETGSQLVVYLTGTTTEKFRTDNSGTSVQWTEAYTSDITYDVTIQKAGFFPIRLTNLTASTIPITTSINQLIDRAYQTSSGLTYNTNAGIDTSTKKFNVSDYTTVQNYYSFWIEQWIDETALRNIEFPISTFGGNSFSFDQGYEFTSSSLQYLSRDGFRYFDSGNVTARYAAILSQGVSTGLQAEYQQAQGGSISDAQNTGNVDQVIQIYGDATHGNFDYTDYLVFKVQANGFRQAEADIVSVFGTLEEQFYVASLNTLAIPNFTIGNPNVTGLQIIDEGEDPDLWDAGDGTPRKYRLTIKDIGDNTGKNILRWLNYNLSLDATFQGKDPFYYPEMVIDNGSSYETIRGILYGSTSNVLEAGVRVIDGGGNPHKDFTRFQSDDGSYGVPIQKNSAYISGITIGSRLKIFNITTGLTVFNGFINATTYTEEYTEGNNYTEGNQLEITLTYQIGTTAKIPLISQAIVGATGWSLLVNQKDLTAYSSLGADGSTVTEYNIDSNTGNLEIDANDTDCFSSKRRLVARYYYLITTEEGIDRYVNAIVLEDEANAIIDRTITNLTVDNTGNCTLNLTDSDFRLYTSDGSSWIKNPPTGNFGIISDSGKVYVKGQDQLENKVQKLVDAENADIFVTPTRFTKKIAGTDTVLQDKSYSTNNQGTRSLTEFT